MSIEGRCLCGAVTYRADADPLQTVLCHCRDCQRQSGAAASINAVFPRDAFAMEGETLTMFETTGTDTRQPRERWFCNRCGSPIVTFAAELGQFAIVKAGTLDEPHGLAPAAELWGDSAHGWWAEDAGRTRFPRDLPAG